MTLAFSIKSGQWTTEYSFEPTCYANTDGRMVAFKDVGGGSFWLHDEDETKRNTFYDLSYKSELSVVSNENPSAVKNYEAMSLEVYGSSPSMFNASFKTIDQNSSVSDSNFTTRDRVLYTEIPRAEEINSSNLLYVGKTASLPAPLLQNKIRQESLPMSFISGSVSTGRLFVKDHVGKIYGFYNYELSGQNFNGNIDSLYPEGSPNLGTINDEVTVIGFDEKSKSLELKKPSSANDVTVSGFIESPDGKYDVYVGEKKSGSPMKGQYLVVELKTAKPAINGDQNYLGLLGDNFELYAINVDQHKVNLDHSLGQNN